MGRKGLLPWVACAAVVALFGCDGRSAPPAKPPVELQVAPDLRARRARFAQQLIDADTTKLTPGDFKALDHLVRAAATVDEIFQRQTWQGYEAFAPRALAVAGPDAAAVRDYLRIMVGPWDRIDGFRPFVGDVQRPPGAGFYPEDLTRAGFAAWLAAHPADAPAFTSPLTVIRRDGKDLVAVPYSKAFADLVRRLASELSDSAAATTDANLKKFLTLRAESVRTDDYFASDMAWVDLDAPIEVAIGPFGRSEDGLIGYKASFGAVIGIERRKDSEQLAKYGRELPYLESRLPIPVAPTATARGTVNPIRVVDEVIAGGVAHCGPLAVALDLPDDLRVREGKGSKTILLKNVLRIKYDSVLAPTGLEVLAKDEAKNLDFDAYYHHVLFHELAHALGPARIKVGGRDTEVGLELKERFAAIEEAKADVLGVYALAVLANRKVVPVTVVERLPWTYLAGLFQNARFGTADARGLAAVGQLNYLLAKGALATTSDGRFRPVLEKFAGAVRSLARELLTIESEGSYDKAGAWLGTYGKVPESVRRTLDGLTKVPVDVDPVFAVETRKR